MGEDAQKIGKKLESFSWNLFDTFGWSEKFRDKQINCNRTAHKNSKDLDKKTHGIDIYFEHEDPYINKMQGVFIECKNRQWTSINKSSIENWVAELINTMECASSYDELQGHYCMDSDRNCGLLLINANDNMFNKEKFYNYLNDLVCKSKKMPFKVFVAGNDMINKWWAINNINATDYKISLQYIYLSINNSRPLKNQALSINQLFSKYIFAEYEYEKSTILSGQKIRSMEKKAVILCFDDIGMDCFNYLWSMCRFYQFETTYKEFDICFYPSSSKDVEYVKEHFLTSLKQYEGGIDNEVLAGISIKFLQNRNLNVVENG